MRATAAPLIVAAVLLASPKADAATPGTQHPFGIGLMLGEPAGISGKFFFSDDFAVTGLIGGIFRTPGAVVGVDALFHFRDLMRNRRVEVGMYAGGGGLLGFWNRSAYHTHDSPFPHSHSHQSTDAVIMARAVVGGVIWPRKFTMEFFLELGPALQFLPTGTFLDITGAAGARYYF